VLPPTGWGAAHADRYDPANGRQVIVPASKLMVHHTASNQPEPGGEEAFTRSIEAYGESRDGAAVEYHYLFYPSGVCHGGFGDTRGCHSAQTDPSAGVNYNETAIGVTFVGYFHPPYDHQLTTAALDTFQAWLAWMIDSGRLEPVALQRAPGPGAPGWYGHRDVFATACPGDNLYPRLPDIIQLPSEDEMTEADWARMQTLIHSTVLDVMRSAENANIQRVYSTEGTVIAMREQEVRDILQIEAHEAGLGIMRSDEFANIIATNTA
jgi:hypothetical protein